MLMMTPEKIETFIEDYGFIIYYFNFESLYDCILEIIAKLKYDDIFNYF